MTYPLPALYCRLKVFEHLCTGTLLKVPEDHAPSLPFCRPILIFERHKAEEKDESTTLYTSGKTIQFRNAPGILEGIPMDV